MKILQFGTGIFLRGFWGWICQQVVDQAEVDLKITMVKLTPSAAGDVNGLLNPVIKIQGVQDSETIDISQNLTVYNEFIHPYDQWQAFLKTATDPEYRVIVSNSTEAGIVWQDEVVGEDCCPASYPAKICLWLNRRFQTVPEAEIHILAFELIENNARQLKVLVLRHAEAYGFSDEFSDWIDSRCHFTNTLVDRIVTRGEDGCIVVEPFHFLALENDRILDVLRLDVDGLNVVFSDVDIWRNKKVRLLNGSHMLMAMVGPAAVG